MCVWYCGSVGFALRVFVGVLSDSRSHLGVKVSEWLSVSLWAGWRGFQGVTHLSLYGCWEGDRLQPPLDPEMEKEKELLL